MANSESPANNEYIRKFLIFMESDTKGSIIIEQVFYTIPIQFFLDKQPFAMNYYREFIKTSTRGFPSINTLIMTIDEANRKCKYFEQKSHFFCMDMWLYLYH
jgi:hypothetical protein